MLLSYNMGSCSNNCPTQFNGVVGNNFVLNPNPVTNGILNVSVKHNAPWFTMISNSGLVVLDPLTNQTSSNTVTNYNPLVGITILNQLGVIVDSYTSIQLPTALNIPNLPQGTYQVVMRYMGQTESYTIIVN